MIRGVRTAWTTRRNSAPKKLLAEGRTSAETARRLGISSKTLWLWRRDEEFSRELEVIRRQLRDSLREEINAGAAEAITLLRSTVNDPAESPEVRVQAASILVERANLGTSRKTDHEVTSATDQGFKLEHLTPAQLTALRACPDGLVGIPSVDDPDDSEEIDELPSGFYEMVQEIGYFSSTKPDNDSSVN